jgi:hypothetical protein
LSEGSDNILLNLILIFWVLFAACLVAFGAHFKSIPRLLGGFLMLGIAMVYLLLVDLACLDRSTQSCRWFRDRDLFDQFLMALAIGALAGAIARWSHGHVHKTASYIAGASALAAAGVLIYFVLGMWIEPETITG